MRTQLASPIRRLALVASFLALTACQPVFILPGGGGPAACPQGSYHVTSQVLNSVLPSRLGNLHVTPSPGGDLALTITANSWNLAGSQSFDVSGSSPFGAVAGTASVSLAANGSWLKVSPTALRFAVKQISGTGNFQGTVSNMPVNLSASLADIGLARVYGFVGNADFSCGAAPNLTLTFTSLKLTLDKN